MQSNAVNTFSICAAQTREEPSMKIGIGNDHAAVELKNIISEHLKERGCEVVNFGTDTSESFDYPIAGYKWVRPLPTATSTWASSSAAPASD